MDKLKLKLEEISVLSGVEGLLGWDQMAMMPSKAADLRAKQTEILSIILHERRTSPELGKLIEEAQKTLDLDDWDKANLKLAKKQYDKNTKIPASLAAKMASLSSKGYTTWIEAKQAKDWSIFSPILKEWLDLLHQQTKCLDASKDPYDVLLDQYEPGLTKERLNTVFSTVEKRLVPLVKQLLTTNNPFKNPDESFLKREFDVKKQATLNHQVAKDLGFDMESGRLDTSEHPFTGGANSPNDVRMTTRYRSDEFIQGIAGTVHETGHALYEQGRPEKWDGQPISEALGMGLHESQSLLWERMVGLSLPFWKAYLPSVTTTFGLEKVTPLKFYYAINKVEPNFIRIESDEVTYPLHILLRYGLEKDLMEGKLAVEDVPKVWNQKMKDYLGLVVPDDSKGALQDVHWSGGALGYFPTYLLGAIAANQIFQQYLKVNPGFWKECEEKKFSGLRE